MSLKNNEKYEYKEKANVKKNSKCNNCKSVNNLIILSCSHEICTNYNINFICQVISKV